MAHANLKKTILATDKRAVGHTIKKITLLRPVSTTSVEKSILCLFYCFFFALASILTARFNRRLIKERKNALFHARSGNGPLGSCYSEKEKNCLKSLTEVDKYKSIN